MIVVELEHVVGHERFPQGIIFEGIMPLRLERRKIARLQSYRSELA